MKEQYLLPYTRREWLKNKKQWADWMRETGITFEYIDRYYFDDREVSREELETLWAEYEREVYKEVTQQENEILTAYGFTREMILSNTYLVYEMSPADVSLFLDVGLNFVPDLSAHTKETRNYLGFKSEDDASLFKLTFGGN